MNAERSDHIRVCERCGIQYDWRRSPSSSLKMTYCGSLCERGDLGFTIEALLRYERRAPESVPVAEPVVRPVPGELVPAAA